MIGPLIFGNSHVAPLAEVPGPPKEPKIMAQDLKLETMGSIGSILLAFLEV